MAWDFMANSVAQTTLSDEIEEGSQNFDAQVENMYGKINEMGSSWVGDDYDLFVEGCNGYKTALADLSSSMMMYSIHFDSVAAGTDDLASTLINIINYMTTFSGQGGSTVGTGNGNGNGTGNGNGNGNGTGNGNGNGNGTGNGNGNGTGNGNGNGTGNGNGNGTGNGNGNGTGNGTGNGNGNGTGNGNGNGTGNGNGNGTGNGNGNGNGTGSTPDADSVTYNYGDTVKINGNAAVYIGTTSSGTNLYKDPNTNYIYYVNSNGDYTRSNATYDGYYNYGVNVEGEVVYPGEVNSSVTYNNGNDAPAEYVASGGGTSSSSSTYVHTSSNSTFTDNSTHISISGSNSEFTNAINNHENIYLDAGVTVKADPKGILNTTKVSDGREATYLVYDEGTGKYYVADSNGNYSTQSGGYEPRDFTSDDGGAYFN